MNIGLQKEEIVKILEEQGIVSGNVISAELVRNAIATVIVENNKLIRQSATDIVTNDINKQIKNLL